eukprot:TRINITY_DN4326_c0_g1_i4.p2 TRINITY_DN4326_c0_g1~~TRINITY_DN4326_c0_g1_i4.p2  ORF type:complete len:272 (+),score=71.44 TRINITY_DN4326_c0_g1_i4:1705-2520(+)
MYKPRKTSLELQSKTDTNPSQKISPLSKNFSSVDFFNGRHKKEKQKAMRDSAKLSQDVILTSNQKKEISGLDSGSGTKSSLYNNMNVEVIVNKNMMKKKRKDVQVSSYLEFLSSKDAEDEFDIGSLTCDIPSSNNRKTFEREAKNEKEREAENDYKLDNKHLFIKGSDSNIGNVDNDVLTLSPTNNTDKDEFASPGTRKSFTKWIRPSNSFYESPSPKSKKYHSIGVRRSSTSKNLFDPSTSETNNFWNKNNFKFILDMNESSEISEIEDK